MESNRNSDNLESEKVEIKESDNSNHELNLIKEHKAEKGLNPSVHIVQVSSEQEEHSSLAKSDNEAEKTLGFNTMIQFLAAIFVWGLAVTLNLVFSLRPDHDPYTLSYILRNGYAFYSIVALLVCFASHKLLREVLESKPVFIWMVPIVVSSIFGFVLTLFFNSKVLNYALTSENVPLLTGLILSSIVNAFSAALFSFLYLKLLENKNIVTKGPTEILIVFSTWALSYLLGGLSFVLLRGSSANIDNFFSGGFLFSGIAVSAAILFFLIKRLELRFLSSLEYLCLLTTIAITAISYIQFKYFPVIHHVVLEDHISSDTVLFLVSMLFSGFGAVFAAVAITWTEKKESCI